MNSKNAVAAIVGRIKTKASRRKLGFVKAATEIAQALNIKHEAAFMMLYGLCATGNVRWVDSGGEVVEEDECTIADFTHKPKLVDADDVRHWLTEWSSVPRSSRREAVIAAMIAEGLIPPRKISWKMFCKQVRDKCNGWLPTGDPALGFSGKQIQRIVKDLRDK
jgi:hypothetical protein